MTDKEIKTIGDLYETIQLTRGVVLANQPNTNTHVIARNQLRDAQNDLEIILTKLAIGCLQPKRRVAMAQRLLVDVVDREEITYGNFEAAKACQRYIKGAVAALRGLSL